MRMPPSEKGYVGTFLEIREDIAVIMDKLKELGITKKDVVNVALEAYFARGMEQVVKELAVWKAKQIELIAEKLAEEKKVEQGVEK